MVNTHQTDWDEFIDGALFSQRTKPHASTKLSPFFLLYGREAVYPSQLPDDFSDDSVKEEPSASEIEAHISLRKNQEPATSTQVIDNITQAHGKQQKDYKKRVGKSRTFRKFNIGDEVLIHDTRKAATKQRGNLTNNYTGPYKITDIYGKTATLQTHSGHILKKHHSIDHLKYFQRETNQNTEEHITDYTASDQTTKIETYIKDLQKSNQLQLLLDYVGTLQFSKPKNLSNLQQQLIQCPMQTFISEVSKDAEDEMDIFATKLLPFVKDLNMDLSRKTTTTMLLASTCVRAAQLHQPVLEIAQTLRLQPPHLKSVQKSQPLANKERLSVGGETLEVEDLSTLDGSEWLNDKIINSYLGLLKREKNLTNLHVFVLPSYTAVLWENNIFDQWMFKKVPFSMYRHILMPINSNGNHWILMVVDVVEKAVSILDSMHGEEFQKWMDLWRKFTEGRNALPDVEPMGPWTMKPMSCSQQKDSSSCGVFTLMNAECITSDVPVDVMRQVHCKNYREYIRDRLMSSGTSKDETHCDMPGCTTNRRRQRWVQCTFCGRWMHRRCSGLSVKSAVEEEYVCCICTAMYT